jgi:inner membrane protein
LAVAAVLVLHPLLIALHAPLVVVGVLDWAAHLATAVLVLVNLPFALPARVLVAVLLASVIIDVDHIPHYLGEEFLTAGAPRPYTHSAAAIVAALAVAAVLRRRAHRAIAVGVALGLVAHLARDVATGPGIPLLWPLTSAGVRIPFWLEAAVLAALATRGWLLADRLPLVRNSSDSS